MKQRTGNMWDAFDGADLFLFTANSTIISQKKLVMGAGMAKQVRDSFPGIAHLFGQEMTKQGIKLLDHYGVFIPNRSKLGAFQTKTDWRLPSSLELIVFSVQQLMLTIETQGYENVHLNFPGVGLGQLSYEKVLSVVTPLPDCVTLWRYK